MNVCAHTHVIVLVTLHGNTDRNTIAKKTVCCAIIVFHHHHMRRIMENTFCVAREHILHSKRTHSTATYTCISSPPHAADNGLWLKVEG